MIKKEQAQPVLEKDKKKDFTEKDAQTKANAWYNNEKRGQ